MFLTDTVIGVYLYSSFGNWNFFVSFSTLFYCFWIQYVIQLWTFYSSLTRGDINFHTDFYVVIQSHAFIL